MMSYVSMRLSTIKGSVFTCTPLLHVMCVPGTLLVLSGDANSRSIFTKRTNTSMRKSLTGA